MGKRHVFVSAAIALVVVSLGAIWLAFQRDMRRAYQRIGGASIVISSAYGDIEYREGGKGPPVLVVHGSGGGYDQGEFIARTVLGGRFHWIAPSRFGYLRSTFQQGATFDEQAHAYARLLDHLRIRRAAVVALSHGGPSALLFAALHPDRVTSLTLISAGVASSTASDQAQASRQGDALRAIYQRDYRYWALTHAFRGRFLKLMGASDQVIRGLTDEQRALADELIDGMNPVSRRAAGVSFDNTATMPNARIAAIRAPTLIVHATDDTLQLFRNAEYAAATIPGARLAGYSRGGHLLLAIERASIARLVGDHILANAD